MRDFKVEWAGKKYEKNEKILELFREELKGV